MGPSQQFKYPRSVVCGTASQTDGKFCAQTLIWIEVFSYHGSGTVHGKGVNSLTPQPPVLAFLRLVENNLTP